MSKTWPQKLEYGWQCATDLDAWLQAQQHENSKLRWSAPTAWEDWLLRQKMMPLIDRFHCTEKTCRTDSRAFANCPRELRDRCDRGVTDVFDYVEPVGTNLMLLRRYLDAGSGREDSIFEKDFDRRPKSQGTRLKVIWSFAVDWLKKHKMRIYKKWSSTELLRLEALAPEHSLSELASILGRTKPMIASKCRVMGLQTRGIKKELIPK